MTNAGKRRAAVLVFWATALAAVSLFAAEPGTDDATTFTQGEIIVTGRREPAEQTNTIDEVNAEDIRQAGATNAAEALRGVAGLRVAAAPTSVSANGKDEMLATLRGFDPRDIIILIDGVPEYEPYFHVLDLRQIPVTDIAKIQVIKGPSSVLYGPNALGGIINIITKKGAGGPQGHVEGAGANYNTYLANASVLGGSNGFDYFLAPSFEKSDGFPVPRDFGRTRNENGGLRNNSDYFDYSISGKTGWSAGDNSVSLSLNQYEFRGGVPYSMEAVDPATLWRKLWRKTAVSLHGEANPVSFFDVRAKAFYTNFYNTITTYEDTTMSSIADRGGAVSTYNNAVYGYVLMPEFILGRGGAITLSNIYKRDEVKIQDEVGAPWSAYRAETFSGAGEYAVHFYRFDLTAGGAYHYLRRFSTPTTSLGADNDAADAEFGIAYSPIDAVALRAAAARKTAFPDLMTLYGSNGNPNLKPEHAINVDVGVKATPAPEVEAQVTGFYSNVRDLIGKKDTGNTYTFANTDKAVMDGAEVSLTLNLFRKILFVKGNYTYLHTADLSPGRTLKSLDFRPEHTAYVDGRVYLPFGLHAAAQYLYVSERKYEQPGETTQVRTLPEYGVVNARLGQTFTWGERPTSCEIYAEVKNLLDVYYEDSPEKASPGRTLLIGASFDF